MLGQRELTAEDVSGILRRGWLFITIPLVLGPVLALAVAYFLPAKYTSISLVMIEQQKVPDTVVKSVVQENLIARISTMEEKVLSRSKLQPMIEKYSLYRSEVARGVGMDDLLVEMRENIMVIPVSSIMSSPSAGNSRVTVVQSSKDEIPGFTVAFTYDRPKIAQEVCNDLVSGFIDASILEHEKMAEDTTTFLNNQLTDAKRKLDEEDAKMGVFQKKYAGELPEDGRDNLAMLQSISSRLDAINQSLQRTEQEKTTVETLLAEQVSYWDAVRNGTGPSVTSDKEIAGLQERLAAMEARYTPDYPDVVKLKATIEELKKTREGGANAGASDPSGKGKSAGRAAPPPGVEPPDIQKLRSQLRGLDEAVGGYRREQAAMAQQAKSLESKLQLSPTIAAEYKTVSRDYHTAQDFYNDLLGKRNNSGMATDLERSAEGEQFTILDPPSLPETPSFPIYWMFLVGGLGGGLIIGLTIVLLREMKDKAIRSERDIEFFLELPTLVVLPSVGALPKRKNGRFGSWWRKRRKAKLESRAQQPAQA